MGKIEDKTAHKGARHIFFWGERIIMGKIEDKTVVVLHPRELYEAEMVKAILESDGIPVYLLGNEVRVPTEEKTKALSLISTLQDAPDGFVCQQCGETAPPGFSECPMCEPLRPEVERETITITEYAKKTELTPQGRVMKTTAQGLLGIFFGSCG